MIGNFREVLFFAFLASREQFAKIIPQNFLHLWGMMFQELATSSFLAILTPTEACQ